MGSEHYCLRWNNHQSNLLGVFSQLLQDESLVDVTLACAEGHSIRAHKVVLSACSSYFQTLFVDHPTRHPIVILKDVRFAELRTLVEFMYKGEVNVEYCQLSALLKTAESLKVKGLAEMTNLNSTRDDRSEVQQQKHSSNTTTVSASDTPMTPELVTKRIVNDDIGTPPPGGSISPPPPAKRPNRGHRDSVCEDNESCDEGGGGRANTPEADDLSSSARGSCAGPSDMSISNSATSCNPPAPTATATCTASTSRLPSPHSSEPVPGPSGMLPVQQVPLSLKKEVDWDRNAGDDKSTTGESSSDYRQSHDSEVSSVAVAAAAAAAAESRFGSACAVAARGRCAPELQISSRTPPPFQFPFSPFAGAYGGPFGDPSDPAAQGCSILGLLQRQGLLAAAASPLSEDSGRSSAGPAAAAYRCPICMAAFPSTWLLEQHSTLQHSAPSPGPGSEDGGSSLGGDEEKPFKCEQCGQSYRYRSAYLKHREQNHRARLPADKLFTCDVCGMQFRYLKSFKKHRLNHALEKLHSKSPSDLDVFARAVRGGNSSSGIFCERPFRPPSSNQPESTSDYSSSRDSPFALMPGGSASSGRMNGDATSLFSPPPALLIAGREGGRVTAPPVAIASSSSSTSAAASSAGAASPSAASSSSAADGGSDQVSSSNEAVGSNASDSGVSTVFERAASAPVSKSEQQNFYKFSVDDYYYAGMERKGAKTERASDGEQDETIDSLAFALSVQAAGGAAAAAAAAVAAGAGAPDATAAAAVAAREAALRSAQEASLINFLRLDAAERQRERRFACPFCGKCVRSKENLKLHVRKHTGERPFVCLFCGRAFGGKSDLTRHLRIHTGERPYHCEMCGKCFARADYLSKHLTTHIHNSQR